MKKTIIICASFAVFAFICVLIYGMNFLTVPEEILSDSVNGYRFAETMGLFISIFPVVIATGYTIGLSVAFGNDQDGSLIRFSSAMFKRFRKVLIFCLCCVLLFTVAREVFNPIINGTLASYMEKPVLSSEYYRVADKLYTEGEYELSYIYAKNAYEVNQEDQKAYDLMIRAEIEADKERISKLNRESTKGFSRIPENRKFQQRITAENPSEVYSLLIAARKCMEVRDWFGAHFNATEALKLASSRDINIKELKQISNVSWEKLSNAQERPQSEEQIIFGRKMEGYTALMNDEVLKAYYIFKGLSMKSKTLEIDPDVVTFLNECKKRVEQTYFFIDETYNLKEFEKANNIHFCLNRKDGTKVVVFVKGVTPVVSSSEIAQYLRGLSLFVIDSEGNFISGFFDSYAKMVSLDSSLFDEEARLLMGIDEEAKYVPYIMLKSVDRKNEGIVNEPEQFNSKSEIQAGDFIVLPVEYDDLKLLQEASNGPEAMTMVQLFNFTLKAEKYGYAGEVYAQMMLDRFIYPFFTLVIMLLLASFGWYCRLKEGQTFKFIWILMFPFLSGIFYIIYRFCLILYKLINYALLGFFNHHVALLIGLLIQIVLIFLVSVLFLAGKTTGTGKMEE